MKKLNLYISLLFLLSFFGLSHPLSTENELSAGINEKTNNILFPGDSILILTKYPSDTTSGICSDTIYTVRFRFDSGSDTLSIKKNILVSCEVPADSVLISGYQNWITQFINQ